MMKIPLLAPRGYHFPRPPYALAECDGLAGVSGDLDTGWLLSACGRGIFPWFNRGGWFFWYAVALRAAIVPESLHIDCPLAKTLRNKLYRVTVNCCFEKVIAHCADMPRPEQDGTWIEPVFQTAYLKLHHQGYAHSFECWLPDEQGEMQSAGGFYGVQTGCVFYGESMFALRPDASETAFACATPFLAGLGVALIDCQQDTEHMRRFGSQLTDFADFQTALKGLNVKPSKWNIGCGMVAEDLLQKIGGNWFIGTTCR